MALALFELLHRAQDRAAVRALLSVQRWNFSKGAIRCDRAWHWQIDCDQGQKVVRDRQFLAFSRVKCASRHDIGTSKSGPTLMCFVNFHLETCFSPQRRAIFRHRNYKKCFGAEVFCIFWCQNVRRAIFDFSSDHMTPHPPLQGAYFSTHPTHESLKKHCTSRLL